MIIITVLIIIIIVIIIIIIIIVIIIAIVTIIDVTTAFDISTSLSSEETPVSQISFHHNIMKNSLRTPNQNTTQCQCQS